MIKKTLKTIKRAPVRAVAVLLFAAVITMIICSLQASNEAELRNYEEAYQSVPVTVTVTGLASTDNTNYRIYPWVYDLFTGENPIVVLDLSSANSEEEEMELIISGKAPSTEISFSEYLKDIQIRLDQLIDNVNNKTAKNPLLIGITSLSCDKQLLPEYGCEIKWYEGYDESIFEGEEQVCIIHEDMVSDYDNGQGETILDFSSKGQPILTFIDGEPVMKENEHKYQCNLKIVGTYTAGDGKSIYCPFSIIKLVYGKLDQKMLVDSISATLADNSRLEEFRELASSLFTDPSQVARSVPWKCHLYNRSIHYFHEYYDNAIDIADENLFDLSVILEDSIKFNRTVTMFVVILSVVAGFLVGFLMVRRRKRDILLMRMVGESNARVYVGFALEQMICIILGIAVGGAYYNWNPINNLVTFAVAYFIALSLALVIFMSKKLIKNVKEDE